MKWKHHYSFILEKKGKRGKAARPSLVGNRLTEIENELKAIEEDAIHEKRTNNKGDSSLEEDSDDEVTNYIGKEIVFLAFMVIV